MKAEGSSHPLLDLDLALTAWEPDGAITFEVRSDDWAVAYEMTFGGSGPIVRATGTDAQIELAKGGTRQAF